MCELGIYTYIYIYTYDCICRYMQENVEPPNANDPRVLLAPDSLHNGSSKICSQSMGEPVLGTLAQRNWALLVTQSTCPLFLRPQPVWAERKWWIHQADSSHVCVFLDDSTKNLFRIIGSMIAGFEGARIWRDTAIINGKFWILKQCTVWNHIFGPIDDTSTPLPSHLHASRRLPTLPMRIQGFNVGPVERLATKQDVLVVEGTKYVANWFPWYHYCWMFLEIIGRSFSWSKISLPLTLGFYMASMMWHEKKTWERRFGVCDGRQLRVIMLPLLSRISVKSDTRRHILLNGPQEKTKQ